jgi:uncharacterized protein (TIGR03435 family)
MTISRVSMIFAVPIWIASLLIAQDRSRLSFDAASIRSNPAAANGALRGRVIVCQGADGTIGRPAFVSAGPAGEAPDPIPQGRCRGGNVTLMTLVATAYEVSERDVSSGPGWAASNGFQVETKAENTGTVTTAELRAMLRTFLADRFKLSIRREQRQGQAFVLTVRPNGHKLKEATGNEQPLHTELSGQRGQQRVVLFGQSSTREFASVLASSPFTATAFAGLPLLDKTNLSGIYNFNLTLIFVDRSAGPPEMDPSLPTALQEQLGLRLESQTVPIEVIVIDHAETPSEN